MANAGYDPLGMASFFDYMGRTGPEPSRVNAVQFLIDHPIFSDRVAEAQDRANQIGRIHHEDSLGYLLIRERLRTVAGDPQAARQYYANLLKNGGGKTIQERYGKDVAEIATRNPAAGDRRSAGTGARVSQGHAVLWRARPGIPGEQPIQRIRPPFWKER